MNMKSYKKVLLLIATLIFINIPNFAQNRSQEDEIKDRAKQKVGLLCEYITSIANKKEELQRRLHYCKQALSLFIGKGDSYEENGVLRKGVLIGISSLNRKNADGTPQVNYKLMKLYLNGLANMRYARVDIRHTDIADFKISDLRKHPTEPNMFTCTVDIEQYFEGYNGDGQLLYYDKVIKRVKCYVIREVVDGGITTDEVNYEYLVLLGDVDNIETTKERMNR